jgi:hypothetical protein
MWRKKMDNIIKDIKMDINAYKHLLDKLYKKRERLDDEILYDQYDQHVIDVEVYHIDLEVEYLKGSIGASEHIIQLMINNTDNL